jgi:hypothetical protein
MGWKIFRHRREAGHGRVPGHARNMKGQARRVAWWLQIFYFRNIEVPAWVFFFPLMFARIHLLRVEIPEGIK